MVNKSLTERLMQCYTGVVCDAIQEMGSVNQTLPNNIRPLNTKLKTAGQVFTIEGERAEGLDTNETLLKWCELLSKAPANTVLICQPNDNEVAHMGELSAATLQYKKVLGYIVDGGCRDSQSIDEMGFAVFCKYYTPVDVVRKWIPKSYGEPIKIGSVTINSGDYVLADRDGIVIIPLGISEVVIDRTEEMMQSENLVRKAILQGVDPVEAYLKYGKF